MKHHELGQRDLSVVWHPCAQMKDYEQLPMIPIRRGEGVWLEDYDGKRYLDAISSWWVNLFGHANPRINAAIKGQLDELEHVIFSCLTHAPAVQVAERLTKLAPEGLTRCFFADNGSSAVEAALKMSFHYWRNRDRPKKSHFICLTGSYHGETVGALSVGDVPLYRHVYEPLLWNVTAVQSPDGFGREPGEGSADYARRMFRLMEDALEEYGESTCAVIVEPLVQCAGGMRMYDPIYLTLLRDACDRHGVHLIADEIAVGFGRTGTLFACEQAGIRPDLMCLSKGLTGGYLPLSTVLTTDDIYDAFYDDYENLTAFLHSHSYCGNPLACAAALATLDIFEQDGVIERNRKLAAEMARAVEPLRDHPHIGDVRQTGMILALEMVKDRNSREPYPWQERRGLEVFRYGIEHETLLRPLGNVVYFMPPYVITPEQIHELARVAGEGINRATAG